MRNFFEHKAAAERRTHWLLFSIMLAVLAMGSMVFALAWLTRETFFMRTPLYLRPSSALQVWPLFGWCVAATAAVVGLASVGRIISLRDGGPSIANMLGGRLVNGRPRDALDRRLLNVVSEMAIAAGTPLPQVYVLDYEPGINALAAGWELSDAIIAVTHGSLEKLTRDELQGVIAHEFSHILHGDARLNLRLMGTVFGMLSIALLGKQLLRAGSATRKNGALFAFAGLMVAAIGYLGALFGNLIKAAVSRQREYLADAAAVQFTRNPAGIAGALKKIGGHAYGARLLSAHAEEANHFFFGPVADDFLSLDVFATHPPLSERIQRLDPSFDGAFVTPGEGVIEPALASENARRVDDENTPAGPPPLRAAEVVRAVGTAGRHDNTSLAAASAWLAQSDPQLLAACESSYSACALVFALLLAEQPESRTRHERTLAELAGADMLKETQRLAHLVIYCDRADRLALSALAAPALRELSRKHEAILRRATAALVEHDGSVSLFEHLLSYVLGLQHARIGQQPVRRRLSLAASRAEVQLVLSALAHAGAAFQDSAPQAFAAATACMPLRSLALLESSPHLTSALGPALDVLRALRPSDAAIFVHACAHAVLSDRRVTEDEVTLLRAVCVALDAPLPRLA